MVSLFASVCNGYELPSGNAQPLDTATSKGIERGSTARIRPNLHRAANDWSEYLSS